MNVMAKAAKKGYASAYERYLGEAEPNPTDMVFWVGVREGDLHGGPVRRHLTSCYRPAPVFDADGTLVFKGNALSDELYVVPECEYRFLQGDGSERWNSSSGSESGTRIESVSEADAQNTRPNARDARENAPESPLAAQNCRSSSKCAHDDEPKAKKRRSVTKDAPKRASRERTVARRRRSCVIGRPVGDLERATLMIGYWNACASA